MTTTAIIRRCDFRIGDLVELRSMPQLGPARVVSRRIIRDFFIGKHWTVTIRFASDGSTSIAAASSLRKL